MRARNLPRGFYFCISVIITNSLTWFNLLFGSYWKIAQKIQIVVRVCTVLSVNIQNQVSVGQPVLDQLLQISLNLWYTTLFYVSSKSVLH